MRFIVLMLWFSILGRTALADIQWQEQFEKPEWYQVLGVKKDASPDQIKTAYRDLSRRYHPDRNPEQSELAENIFNQVQWAFESGLDGAWKQRPGFPKEVETRLANKPQSSMFEGVDRQEEADLFAEMDAVSKGGKPKPKQKPKKAPVPKRVKKEEKGQEMKAPDTPVDPYEAFKQKVMSAATVTELEELAFKSRFNIGATYEPVNLRLQQLLPALKTPGEQAEAIVSLCEILERVYRNRANFMGEYLKLLPDSPVKAHLLGIHEGLLVARDTHDYEVTRQDEAFHFYKIAAINMAVEEANREGRTLPYHWPRLKQLAQQKLYDSLGNKLSSHSFNGFDRLYELAQRTPTPSGKPIAAQVKDESKALRFQYPLAVARGKLMNLGAFTSRIGLVGTVGHFDPFGIPTLIVGVMMLPGVLTDVAQFIRRPINYRAPEGMIIDYAEPFNDWAYSRRDELSGARNINKAYLKGSNGIDCSRASEVVAKGTSAALSAR